MLAELDPVARAQLRDGDWHITPAGNCFVPSALLPAIEAYELLRNEPRVVRVRAWDLAATEGAGDHTAGLLLAWLPAARLWLIEHVERGHWGPDGVERVLRATAERDGPTTTIVVERKGGSAGKWR